jgi:hypothetical protein
LDLWESNIGSEDPDGLANRRRWQGIQTFPLVMKPIIFRVGWLLIYFVKEIFSGNSHEKGITG